MFLTSSFLELTKHENRGLAGMKLPKQFWEEDQYGCCGGVEYGFLSTTTDMNVAIQYTGGKALATIFEISVGQVDRYFPTLLPAP